MKTFSPTPYRTRQRAGFTLVELLIVIIIIAILASLSYPVILSVMDRANQAKASAMASQLKTGMSNYIADYGRMPDVGSDSNGDKSVSTAAEWQLVCAILNGGRNISDQSPNTEAAAQNPRKKTYISFNSSDFSDGDTALDYVISPYSDNNGNPKLYVMLIDANYDDVIYDLPVKDDAETDIDISADVAIYLEDVDNPGQTKVNTYE